MNLCPIIVHVITKNSTCLNSATLHVMINFEIVLLRAKVLELRPLHVTNKMVFYFLSQGKNSNNYFIFALLSMLFLTITSRRSATDYLYGRRQARE